MRDHDLIFHRRQNDAGAGEHTGTELTVVVRNVCLYLDQAALEVDRRLDGGDVTVKLGLRIGIHIDLDGLAQLDLEISVCGTVKRRRITLVSSRRTISVPGCRY